MGRSNWEWPLAADHDDSEIDGNGKFRNELQRFD